MDKNMENVLMTNDDVTIDANNVPVKYDAMAALARLQAKAKENQQKAEATVNASEIIPAATEGTYPGVTTNAVFEKNLPSKYGINDRIKVDYQFINPNASDREEVKMTATYWLSSSKKSQYYRFLSELLQKDPRKGFHIKELIGITCEVEITHNHVDNGAYANITGVKRIDLDDSATITL